MSCGGGHRRGSHLALLWHRPEATALIQPLAWEPPYASGLALNAHTHQKKKKKKKKKKVWEWRTLPEVWVSAQKATLRVPIVAQQK